MKAGELNNTHLGKNITVNVVARSDNTSFSGKIWKLTHSNAVVQVTLVGKTKPEPALAPSDEIEVS